MMYIMVITSYDALSTILSILIGSIIAATTSYIVSERFFNVSSQELNEAKNDILTASRDIESRTKNINENQELIINNLVTIANFIIEQNPKHKLKVVDGGRVVIDIRVKDEANLSEETTVNIE